MYSGNPVAAKVVAPPSRREWADKWEDGRPKETHVDRMTAVTVYVVNAGNPGMSNRESSALAQNVMRVTAMYD